MVKLWSKNKKFPLRVLGRIPVFNRLDTFELQIKAEGWIKKYPEIQKIYQDNGLIISFKENDLILEAHMSDRQYTIWCLKNHDQFIKKYNNDTY